ncbi:hypothetical protein NHQ30_003540 [Ciborinia camelliae]|nr:hypothetical protein NHQ30_003540 [Ciborinia camelliae]
MSLSTQSLDGEDEDATLISSLISQLNTKSTHHHTVDFQKTVKVLQGNLVRVVQPGKLIDKATSLGKNHTNQGYYRIDGVSAEENDKFEALLHYSNAPCNKTLDMFEHFLALKPKIRIRIYDHFMDSRISQCFCPECAPRPLSKNATAIFNIPGTPVMIKESPQRYCVPLVLSLLLANKEIYNELRPLFYKKLTALLALKGPLQTFIPSLHTTKAVRLFPAFQNFVTKWIIELPIDAVLPKGIDTQSDWRVKTLAKEVHRFSLLLEHCKALNHLTVVIKVKNFSHTWFEVDDKEQFEFDWLHRFLEFGLDDDKAVKVKIEMHLPQMELWWKKEYQEMWVKGWNAGLIKKGMHVHELLFRDTESGANFVQ